MKKELFTRLFTVILFTLSAFLIIHPFRWSLSLTTSFLLLLNFIIILSATYFSAKAVIVFGSSSILIVLLHSLYLAQFAIFPSLLLVVTTGICYAYCLRIGRLSRSINAELDNIEEEKNVLDVELEHLRLENLSLKQKLQKFTTLKGLTETLSFTLSLDKTTSLITSEAFRIIDKSNVGLLYLVDKERQQLNLVSTKLADPQYDQLKFKKGDIFDSWVLKQHTPLMIQNTKKDFRFNIQDNQEKDLRGVRSLISAPLISENKLLGILRLDNVSQKAYDADDLRLLDIISNLAAVAVENTLLYQEMERLAITDGLTGLFVHRYFQERFDGEISRAIWTNSEFAFLMLDIDKFKSYNDRYGHIAGDIVLKQIAKLINLTVNPGDIVARYGGEEFGILLVETNKKKALNLAEAIRERIADEKFTLRRESTKVSISGGISFFPADDKVKENLIKKADQALYKAKLEGKNRICTI